MPLPRADVVAGVREEIAAFEPLVRGLEQADWTAPSRCAGWTVGDVCAHVAGTLTDLANGRFDGLGTDERNDEQVAERRGRAADDIADEIASSGATAAGVFAALDDDAWAMPAPGQSSLRIGDSVEGLCMGMFLHADDVRAGIGQDSVRGPGLLAGISHVVTVFEGRGQPGLLLALDGMPELAINGGGTRIDGDPLAFLLAATGRADAEPGRFPSDVRIY